MIIVKKGVRLAGLREEALLALDAANEVYEEEGFDCVLTSARGGRHGRYSHHYKGLAIDLRSKHLGTTVKKLAVLAALKVALGADYQVFLEYVGKPNEHYHIEYDPTHKTEYRRLKVA